MKVSIVIAIMVALAMLSGCNWHASTSAIGAPGAEFASAADACRP